MTTSYTDKFIVDRISCSSGKPPGVHKVRSAVYYEAQNSTFVTYLLPGGQISGIRIDFSRGDHHYVDVFDSKEELLKAYPDCPHVLKFLTEE